MAQVEVFTLVRSPNGVVVTSFKKWVVPIPRQEVQYRTTVEVLDDDPAYVRRAPQGNFGHNQPIKKAAQMKHGDSYDREARQPWTSWKRNRRTSWRYLRVSCRLFAPLLAAIEAELSESRARMSQEALDERYPY